MGQRLIGGAANNLLKQIFTNLSKEAAKTKSERDGAPRQIRGDLDVLSQFL